DLARCGPQPDSFLDPCSERLEVGSLLQGHDERDHALTPLLVGPTDDRDIAHVGILREDRLDRFGPHVLAAADDEVASPTEHPHAAILVEPTEVASREPAGGVLRVDPIAIGA